MRIDVSWEKRSVGGDIWVSTSDSVVETGGSVDINVELGVVWVGKMSTVEIVLNVA